MTKIKTFLKHNQRAIITLASAIFIIVGTLIAIQFAKGYRPTRDGTLEGTGLLAASSNPTSARIIINGQTKTTVTNDTLTLKPGQYDVKLIKEGFSVWQKTLTIDAELVTTTDAHLFRTVPSLAPLTFSGAKNLYPSPDGQKIAFSVASPSAQVKAGLYVIELSDRPSLFGKSPKLIAQNPSETRDFSQANILWSPDSSQLIAAFENVTYLLDPTTLTRRTQLTNATGQLPLLFQSWEEEVVRREKQLFAALPEEMLAIATASAQNVFFSPDGEKLLYTATQPVTIPEGLIPPLPATNSQPEERTLQPGNVYVYDLKEDKNFLLIQAPAEITRDDYQKPQLITDLSEASLFDAVPATESAQPKLQDPISLNQTIFNFRTQYSSFPFLNYQWFPTSKHILLNQNGAINIIEYDGTNLTTLYQGRYDDNFVYPWPDGSKLIILTNLTQNPNLPPNLYTINLK